MPESHPFPASITVRISPRERGAGIGLCVEMNQLGDYTYMLFTDAKGVAHVSGEELLAAFDADRSVAPDDFADARTSFTGQVYAKVLEPAELRAAYKSYAVFQKQLRFPAGYETNLKDALIRGVGKGVFKVEVEQG